MTVEIVNTGTELMLGQVLNSHQQWLCRRLAELGYPVSRQVAVPDSTSAIQDAARDALGRAELVIITGGLGPTSDDVTRPAVASLLGRGLREDPETLSRIQKFFEGRGRPLPRHIGVQALIIEGASILPNQYGTAPGLAIQLDPNPLRSEAGRSLIVLLPGPGRELRPMFDESVVPLLAQLLPMNDPFACTTLRTVNLGESVVQERIEPPLAAFVERGLEIGYCARPGQVDVRLTAHGHGAADCVAAGEQVVRAALENNVFATGDENLEATVIRLLTERNASLALAESCTGGCIAHRLTNVPGASSALKAGWVTYSNEAKRDFLGVSPDALASYGAVSREVAREMAQGARRIAVTDFAVAVTGIAGPSGATPAKPVGTVFIAVAWKSGVDVIEMHNPWDRVTFKDVTSQQALNALRLILLKQAWPNQPREGVVEK